MIQFQNTMSLIHFELNYTISQVTSQRAFVEINSLDANFFSENNNFKLIYSVEEYILNLLPSNKVIQGYLIK